MPSYLQGVIRGLYQWGSPRFFYHSSYPWLRVCAVLAVILLSIAWVWGLAFAPTDRFQGHSARIIYVHVPAAFISQTCYMLMAAWAIVGLVWRIKLAFMLSKQAIVPGALFTALTLVTGSIWWQSDWGTWWQWDARMTSVLILLFLYLGLWALHSAIENPQHADRAAAILTLVGAVNIPIIKYSVHFWNTLHQGSTLRLTEESTIHSSMLWPLLLALLGLYLAFFALLLMRTRTEILWRERRSAWVNEALKEAA